MPIGDQCEPNSEGEDGGEKSPCPPRAWTRRLGKLIKVNYGELVDAMFHRKIPAAVN